MESADPAVDLGRRLTRSWCPPTADLASLNCFTVACRGARRCRLRRRRCCAHPGGCLRRLLVLPHGAGGHGAGPADGRYKVRRPDRTPSRERAPAVLHRVSTGAGHVPVDLRLIPPPCTCPRSCPCPRPRPCPKPGQYQGRQRTFRLLQMFAREQFNGEKIRLTL